MYSVIYSEYYSWHGFVKFTSSNVKYIEIKDKSDFNQDTQYYINLVTSCCCVARIIEIVECCVLNLTKCGYCPLWTIKT